MPLNESLKKAGRIAAVALGVVWILGGTCFFIMRFSTIFYYANQSAFDSLMKKLGQ